MESGAYLKGCLCCHQVTVEDSQLSHLTRDRAKIPQNRRLPTRGHLLAVASASSSDGTLTLDLIHEAIGPDCPRSKTDGALNAAAAEASGKSQSLPRDVAGQTPQPGKRLTPAEKNRCASLDEILTHSEPRTARNKAAPIGALQDLIAEKLQNTERLLAAARGNGGEPGKANAGAGSEAERLLAEATAAWRQAQEVLREVTELRELCQQLGSASSCCCSAPKTEQRSM
ncbi:pleckstrin homology domain-containing family O member 1-like [Perca flavescens]|uniref:pleckstrin homology domain-containing family O member 1-like n=1 Tax=Perca flavescens TaxID=8167 RepID=UPI00106E6C6C|nr:pleckstrin homology domain-containing family O member 1-like [Perca flavescens]